ncbi:hypothetical protein [Saccharothrix syringae]|uniref:Uncharacterized protein n=1 Tax=Saccharothrix syringae TaxID=103733 RepID=A0A5Q0H4H3_SACSY|nr:hypothetical protein [Saccharothrix syringae]QFZ20642.1 hypothetical protein EKG83_27435 [Saccharothrix syringae]
MTSPKPRADRAGEPGTLYPAMLAALSTAGNGQWIAPGRPVPVVLKPQPGAYKKNNQIAHIPGGKSGTARCRPDMVASERD